MGLGLGLGLVLHKKKYNKIIIKSNLCSCLGKISLKWTLFQPCISEYRISLCSLKEKDSCWNGIFKQPRSEEEEGHFGYTTTVDLSSLEGFDYSLEECQEYEIRLRPVVKNPTGFEWSGPEILKPFMLIDKLHPPESMNIFNITENSFLVAWQPTKCSNTKEVEVIISQNGSIVTEYRPQSYSRDHLFTKLKSCTDYLVQVEQAPPGHGSD